MFERNLITMFVAGALFGLCIAAGIAGYIWIHLSKGGRKVRPPEYITDNNGYVVRADKE